MQIVVGCPVHDRGWILERHLQSLMKMLVPEDVELNFLYVLDHCEDNSREILERYHVSYLTYQDQTPHYSRHRYDPSSYGHMADVRNYLIDAVLQTEADYFLSVDSDILVPQDALNTLLEDDKDIVSMILCNQPGNLPRPAHNVMREGPSGNMVHIFDYPKDQLFSCDLTGACYLIKRQVLDAGVRYAQNPQGEDIPFCRTAKRLGFEIWCDSRVKPIHVMYPGVEVIAGYEE